MQARLRARVATAQLSCQSKARVQFGWQQTRRTCSAMMLRTSASTCALSTAARQATRRGARRGAGAWGGGATARLSVAAPRAARAAVSLTGSAPRTPAAASRAAGTDLNHSLATASAARSRSQGGAWQRSALSPFVGLIWAVRRPSKALTGRRSESASSHFLTAARTAREATFLEASMATVARGVAGEG